MGRLILASLALLACPSAAQAQFSSSTIKGVDVYRTDQVSAAGVRAQLGKLLPDYVRLRVERKKDKEKEAKKLESQIVAKVRAMGDFAFAQMYFGEYFTSAERSVYLTFDVVDLNGFQSRMPFRKRPSGQLPDPGGLLAAWRRYDDLGLDLLGRGIISTDERPTCPGFYCLWGSATPELAGLEQKLAAHANSHRSALASVATEDADPKKREAALFALSYTKDGAAFAKQLHEALLDPAEEPRAAALQMLAELAVYHKDIVLDAGKIVAALDYPAVSDRAKALSAVIAMVSNPSYRPYLKARAGPALLSMLRLEQPNNRELAFTILQMLSQASFDSRDYASWEKWVQEQAAARP